MMNKLLPALLLASLSLAIVSPLAHADLSKESAKAKQAQMQKINLNTATVEQLTSLPGVGAKKAQAIVEYRSKVGKFKSVEDLTKVKGIGEKMIVKLRAMTEI
jgi:competence protein ComEA